MTPSTYRALVVDDEPALRNLLQCALLRDGFNCDSASNGVEALVLLKREQFDVLITDLRMPQGNGHALAVEALQLTERPVVIVLTGVLDPRLAKDLLARGVDDVAFKPVDYGLLCAKTKILVDRHRARLRAPEKSLTTPDVESDVAETQLGPAQE